MKQQNKNRLKKAKSPFTTVYNELINDQELTLRDKGLYLFMLSKPNDWAFSIRGLSAQCIEGRDTISKTLNNLIKKGWLRRFENRIAGKYKSYTYEILYVKIQEDKPSDITDSLSEKPCSVNRTINNNYTKKEREGNFYEQNKEGINIFIEDSIQQQERVKSKAGYKKSLIHKFIVEDKATIELYSQWKEKYNVKQAIQLFKGKKYKRTTQGVQEEYILENIEYSNFEFVPILQIIINGVRAHLRVPFKSFEDMYNYLSKEYLKDEN